jgi:hypothetical protein
MNEKEMMELSEEFAKDMKNMTLEFYELFHKYVEKDHKTAVIMALHLPLNLILNFIKDGNNTCSKAVEDLPGIFKRALIPFVTLEKEWGKIPDDKFVEEYTRIYELQFSKFEITDEDRENFKKFMSKYV